ncbi:MAG: lytic transglycosylase domain-containing protein [Atopobiaceae bacterium]|jgi:soluble lytic murein transglycosylase|nr:lytic transglycosylase domain-containing protein [Atopobiaceae bacterium]MCI1318604.1 lytic transglycosylase domain-containing protein [Atopobiaceae bacterium]MCI1389442.1 lytic transglycosylase domain-containing protein [Atopobiaceae bacterium]MCI1432277.1 lytic transglycosylase domain-containing protein [Atopobiaceae bacterium]MCI1470735.1 lytic transglycosylase domain-containing protein [Atopobiaceae bacterium]
MRFLRWFRAIPLAAVALTLAASLLLSASPVSLVREWMCPLDHVDQIQESSARHGVDPYLVCAVIRCESGWDESATSSAGAVGLMQVMPSTAETLVSMGYVDGSAYSPSNLSDPATNIEFGCAYLGYLQSHLTSEDEIIAAYNAGLTKVLEWTESGTDVSSSIDYPETATYLERVKAAEALYRRCYPDGLVVA